MLLWTLVDKFLREHRFSFLLGSYLEVELPGHMVTPWLPNVSHGSCPSFHSHQTHRRAPISLHAHQHLLFSPVFIIAVLVGVKWHLVVVLHFIFRMTNAAECLCMCLLATCMSSLERYLSKGVIFYNFLASTNFFFSIKCPKMLNQEGARHTQHSDVGGGGQGGWESVGREGCFLSLSLVTWLQLWSVGTPFSDTSWNPASSSVVGRHGRDVSPHPQSVLDPLDTEISRMFFVQFSLSIRGRLVPGPPWTPKFSDVEVLI